MEFYCTNCGEPIFPGDECMWCGETHYYTERTADSIREEEWYEAGCIQGHQDREEG